MKKLHKNTLFALSILVICIMNFATLQIGHAQGIIPAVSKPEECILVDKDGKKTNNDLMKSLQGEAQFRTYVAGNGTKLADALGCAVKLGKVAIFMVPYFITYLIQFLLGIAGLISVLFIVLGGYKYITGGLGEDKDSGKKTITHAIIGLLVSLSAWIVVNLIQIALTS